LKHWVKVLGILWVCLGCNVSSLKHAPFCHNAKSYTKQEADWMNNDLSVIVSKFYFKMSWNHYVLMKKDLRKGKLLDCLIQVLFIKNNCNTMILSF